MKCKKSKNSIAGAREQSIDKSQNRRYSVILQFLCPKGTSKRTTSKTHWFRRLEEKKEKTRLQCGSVPEIRQITLEIS